MAPSLIKKGLKLLAVGLALAPTHAFFEPMSASYQKHALKHTDLSNIKPLSPQLDKLRAYHAALDRFNVLLNDGMQGIPASTRICVTSFSNVTRFLWG